MEQIDKNYILVSVSDNQKKIKKIRRNIHLTVRVQYNTLPNIDCKQGMCQTFETWKYLIYIILGHYSLFNS